MYNGASRAGGPPPPLIARPAARTPCTSAPRASRQPCRAGAWSVSAQAWRGGAQFPAPPCHHRRHLLPPPPATAHPHPPATPAGIGLLSVRGSGTSGHVQGNKFNLRGPPQGAYRDRDDDKGPTVRQPNAGILEHNRKREIELEVETMRAQLEDEE